MIILGINAYHGDSSAALVKDGQLLAAIEEERIRRIKHWAGLPTESIKWVLEYTKTDISDVDFITINRNPWARFHKKALRAIMKRMRPSFVKGRLKNLAKVQNIKEVLAGEFGISSKDFKAKFINVEHHRAHLASSFFVSPFDEAALLSVDGFGDFVSTMRGIGRGNRIKVIDEVEYPHSLGVFYTALTQFLGFWNYGDEYKVMGLSALGKPTFLEEMKKIVLLKNNGLFKLDTSYFLHDSRGVEMTWLNDRPKVDQLFSEKLITLLGRPRKDGEEINEKFADIAASMQAMYEKAFFHLLNGLYKKTGLKKVALAGGSIQNSLANGKIFDNTPFEDVYIPPAAHDAGGAIGAAFYFYNYRLGKKRVFKMESPFWGPDFSGGEVEEFLKARNLKYKHLKENELLKQVAEDLAQERVVGWFQGRTEWGPRALGDRSILADPRSKNMKSILNSRIKKREWFRPFAPSVLEEKTYEWFEKDYPVPFMEKVYKIRADKRKEIPAVCHFDGTGRLQTVSYNLNPKYYKLIKAFENLTGVPMVLNTSFNENEPIVNTPKEAIDCFLRTKMDVLIMNNFYVRR